MIDRTHTLVKHSYTQPSMNTQTDQAVKYKDSDLTDGNAL